MGLDGCGASAVLHRYSDMTDKGGCVNILKVSHSKLILSSKIVKGVVELQRHELSECVLRWVSKPTYFTT